MTKALTVSSDVFYYWIADGLWNGRGIFGQTPIQDWAAKYGIGSKTGVALPGESAGRLPTPDLLKQEHAASPKAFPAGTWFTGDNLNTAVGQGDDLATPLQLVNAYGTFANGGTRYTPLIVSKVTRPKDTGLNPADPTNFTVVRTAQPIPVGHVDFTGGTYAKIAAGLNGVVQAGDGTANKAWAAHRTAWPDGRQDRHRAGQQQGRHVGVRRLRAGAAQRRAELRDRRRDPRGRFRCRLRRAAGVQHHETRLREPAAAGSSPHAHAGRRAASMIATTGSISRMRRRDMTAAWRHVDVVLCALVGLATVMGAVMIYSATKHKARALLVHREARACSSASAWRPWPSPRRSTTSGSSTGPGRSTSATVALLVAVLVPGVGSVHKNIRAWFDIGPIQIQPAELAKIATILAIAAYLGRLDKPVTLRHVVVALVVLGIPMGLILLQPDLGTTLVFVGIGVGLLMVGNVPARYLVAMVLLGVLGTFAILNSNALDHYQRDRLTSFVNPQNASAGAIYNTKAAQEAIASGGLTGQGLFNGPQTKGGFVPEQQTDFIFTVPAEELGFAGAGHRHPPAVAGSSGGSGEPRSWPVTARVS